MFYVKDVTGEIRKFNSIPETVNYLEELVKVRFKKTRPQWMQHVIELGYGLDDRDGKTFVESLSDYIETGILKNGRLMKCNIFDIINFNKPEFGD